MNTADRLTRTKQNNVFSRCGYGVIFGAFLTLKMLLNMPFAYSEMSDSWNYLFYITEYKTMGFVPRALLGSVCGIFTDYITWKAIYAIGLVVTVLLIVLASVLFNKAISCVENGKTGLVLFACVFLLMSDNIFYIFDKDHFGIIDTYFIIYTLLAIVFTGNKYLRWTVPVICVVCMMNYEGYVFAYMPLLGIVMLYYCFKEKSRSSIAVFALSCVGVIISFLYFYAFFRTDMLDMLRWDTAEEAEKALMQHTDAEINYQLAELYYFKGAGTFFVDGSWDVLSIIKMSNTARLECLPSALILFGGTFTVWHNVRKTEDDKSKKFIYLLCAVAPLAAVPFMVFSEQMKYISYFAISQFLLLIFFATREEKIQIELKRLEDKFIKNPIVGLFPMCLLIFFRALW